MLSPRGCGPQLPGKVGAGVSSWPFLLRSPRSSQGGTPLGLGWKLSSRADKLTDRLRGLAAPPPATTEVCALPHLILISWATVAGSCPGLAAKLLQSCPTLCDPIDGSPPGSPVPGILQARTLEWGAISFSNA